MTNRKSHARTDFGPPQPPNPIGDDAERSKWLKSVIDGFVAPSKAHRRYYAAILRALWPEGHGIPGPLVEERDIRKAVNKARGKAYHDPFRRMRELQGEEGIKGIIKSGNRYQLVDLTVSDKRVPRTHLSDQDWDTVLKTYGNRCAVCKRTASEARFQQDHKVPRLRGGGDNLENWQPLCDECNNFKSSSCRDCHLDCTKCSWAFPETFKPFHISGELVKNVREYAEKTGCDPDLFVENAIRKALGQIN